MTNIRSLLFAFLLFPLLAYGSDAGVKLRYERAADGWFSALPLGNGRIGAMVYGGTSEDRIALNEVTMWSGQPDAACNELCGADALKKTRDAFFKGDLALGNELGTKYLTGHGSSFGTHLPLGDLTVTFDGSKDEARGYSRTLDMSRAVAGVSYRQGKAKRTNEYFCSNPDHVLVIRYATDAPQGITAKIGLDLLRHGTISAEGSTLVARGDARFPSAGPGGVMYEARVKAVNDGGSVACDGGTLNVKGAKSLVLIIDIRTNFTGDDYARTCRKTVDEASMKSYKQLLKSHVADFNRLFSRFSISLGSPSDASTESLFHKVHGGEADAAFDALFIQYGRYLLLSSSREDSPLPANLQGIWNDNRACNMAWRCDYHLDINIQQNYWSANVANMPETNVALFRYLRLLAKYGHETARKVYGCDGWVAHTINNVWGDTAPGNGVGWALNVTAGAWMATQLWTHFLYTRDTDWLRREGYPLLKETAKFFVDYMAVDPNTGWLETGPSISPENAFRAKDGNVWCLSMMPTIDRAVVSRVYEACIESSKLLGTDADFRARLEQDLKRLPPLRLGSNGELREWLDDVERADPTHRHASHLVTLYPFGQISPRHTPDLAAGCRLFLDRQLSHPKWEDTEWTRGNNINFYARLKDGDKAHESLMGLYRGFMQVNLMTVSPPGVAGADEDIFSFDANEAAVSGACEMILQSYDGCLDFLPALPKLWHDGSVKGICAEGGITADVAWSNGKVVKAVLLSNRDQTVDCRVNGQTRKLTLLKGKKTNVKL